MVAQPDRPVRLGAKVIAPSHHPARKALQRVVLSPADRAMRLVSDRDAGFDRFADPDLGGRDFEEGGA